MVYRPVNHDVRRLQDGVGEEAQLESCLGRLVQRACVLREGQLALDTHERVSDIDVLVPKKKRSSGG